MSRNTPLSVVRYYVKAESFQNLDSTSSSDDSRLNQLIANVQRQLATSYDWAFLKKRWTFELGAGARYVSFPTVDDSGVTGSPSFDRPEKLMIKYASIWQPIEYGISEDPEFNYLDSDENQVLDPVQRWQFYDENKLEVWPLPASTQTLRYIGQRQLTPLNDVETLGTPGGGVVAVPGGGTVVIPPGGSVWNDNATLDLDDLLVTYYTAAEWLGEENSKYKGLMSKAQSRLVALRGTNLSRTRTLIIGRDLFPNRQLLRQVPIVLVGGK